MIRPGKVRLHKSNTVLIKDNTGTNPLNIKIKVIIISIMPTRNLEEVKIHFTINMKILMDQNILIT